MTTKEHNEIIEYVIDKLTQLKIQVEFQDRQRGKKRYVSKASAFRDVIKILKDFG